jgi:hypothetical protein
LRDEHLLRIDGARRHDAELPGVHNGTLATMLTK